MPPTAVPRKEVGRMSDREEVSLKDFLSYSIPEFRGEVGEDPQEFLEETKK